MKKRLLFLFVAMVLAGSTGLCFAEAPPALTDKAKSIFDGKTLDGWEAPGPMLWSVKDGCITGGDGKAKIPYNDFLCTKASYSNFILHFKIKLTGDPATGFINSGMQIRTQRNPTGHEVCGYQCDYGEPSWYAAIYDEGRRNRLMMPSDMEAIRPAFHLWGWNDYVIKADGGNIKTWLNGAQGVNYVEKDPDIASDGILGIQLHGGGNTLVQVKDVFIEELPPTPGAITWEKLGGVDGQRAKLKKPPQADALKPKFTKRTAVVDSTPKPLTGWDGDMKFWHVADDSVSAEIADGQSAAPNESLIWKGTAQDLELTFEYRISGVGLNADVLVRGQGRNDATVVGYQAVLDDGAKSIGRFLEAHGRGALAERGTRASIAPDGRRWTDPIAGGDTYHSAVRAGDWNACRIRATASHLELWINGVLFSSLDDHQANVARFEGTIGFELNGAKGPGKIEFRKILLADLGGTEPPDYQNYQARPAAPRQLDVAAFAPLGSDGKPLNMGFETGTLEGWKAEGDAWQGQPIKGDTVAARNHGQSNHVGEYWIGGYEKIGDKGTGRLTSASFEVTHPWASFLVGGGKDPALTRVEVVEEATGKVIHSASGQDAEDMRREVVDLRQYDGKRIFVRLVDASTKGWGHVNFDDFVFHDKAPASSPVAMMSLNSAGRQKESPVLWHLQPNPAKPTAVPNAQAQAVVAGMMLTHGFQAELIAAEPEVKQPVAFAIDERGRLWVAEAYSYPQKQPEGQGKDRIVIFEDVDGDGSFKKRTVFIEGLNLVSGMEVGFGGVWVGAAPQLIFIPKDKDDKAGKPQVLLDGFGYQDTHETLNSFCWGPDGWLYGNQGVFNSAHIGKPGTPDDKRIGLNSGIWRYHPVRHEFEIFAHGGSNQWGLDYNEAGDLFMTHCRSFWGGGGTTFVIRNGHFWNQANANYAPFISNSAPDFAPDLKNFMPASARYDSGEGGAGKPGTTAIYGGHSHVGTLIYLGDNWPDIYRDHLFTNNLFGRQMNQQENVRVGSAYETFHAGYDLMYTPDEKYMAIDLQTGPDGAVYAIDWCDMQHCHTPDVEKIDRTNGRIYRISWAATYHPVKVDLGAKSDLELAALQTHHNDWYSRAARQLLQERAATGKVDPQAIVSLTQLAATSPNYAHVLRALWTLHVIGAMDQGTLTAALHHADDRVRGWAIRLATEDGSTLPAATLMSMATNDPSPTVRLALASALPVLRSDVCWNVSTALASHAEDATDRFLPKMIWCGLAGVLDEDFARGMTIADKTPIPSLADSIHWYAAIRAHGRDLLAAHIAADSEGPAARELRILDFGLKNEATAPMPQGWAAARDRFAKTQGDVTDELSALFGDKDIIAKTRATLADEHTPLAGRRAAFALLKRIGDKDSVPIFAKLLDIPEFQSAVIPLLAGSNDAATAAALIERFPKFGDRDRIAALGAMTGRAALAKTLLAAVKDGKFDRKLVTSFQVRQMRNLQDAEVNQLLDQSWGKATESSGQMKATIARLQKAYDEAPLWAYDASAGKKTFTQTCAVCHTRNGEGGKLGPDLTGSGRNGVSYFLENIVDPNAVVGDQYQMTLITKRDGTVLTGISNEETDTAVMLGTATEVLIVPKSEILKRQKRAESMMPAGILEGLPERNVIELLKYLTSAN